MKLKAAARAALPAKTFAGPNRSFPIPDKNHAKAALAEIKHAPASAQPKIRAKAEAKLHDYGHPQTHAAFHKMGAPKSGKY